jgi:hypothetical protein
MLMMMIMPICFNLLIYYYYCENKSAGTAPPANVPIGTDVEGNPTGATPPPRDNAGVVVGAWSWSMLLWFALVVATLLRN